LLTNSFRNSTRRKLLKRQFLAHVGKEDSQPSCEFTKRYVKEPAWSEPLRMIANEIGVPTTASPGDAMAIRAGARLIEMALKADPVYAGELAYQCGASVWKEIGGALAQDLHTAYGVPDEHFRQRPLAGMLASGLEHFKDIVFHF
jgi:hypothetical protein